MNYVTIQKLSKDVGINASTIQKMIKQGELTPYKKDGLERVFVNPQEFFSKLKPIESEQVDIDRFLI